MIVIIFVVEPAAGIYRYRANVIVLGSHAKDFSVGAAIVAHSSNILAVENRRDGPQEPGLMPDGQVVVVCEIVRSAGLQSALNGRNPAREHEHDVLTQVCQIPLLTASESLA